MLKFIFLEILKLLDFTVTMANDSVDLNFQRIITDVVTYLITKSDFELEMYHLDYTLIHICLKKRDDM